ncbi:MFS transporter [Vibrio sp.]|uniref:MFS transporter n=1 Tax=Vibrio viridaestus TaxID=2487322 RepID=A0A3N9TJB0_9VIBR|nr:MFS transporter [Vibrio viridaestus]MDC0610277.1 MFS transporter [Vibrio sp.]RQW64389.1 MFS transporter [Vibrio viridaestus]
MTSTHKSLSLFGLLLLVAGQLLPQIDFSIVNVALDVLGKSLKTNETGLVLIVAVYALCFATLIASGARLGDRYGRKKLFLIGVFGFGVASALCGMSQSIYVMLVGRFLQGLCAALLMPQILSTIHATLDGERHSRAVSIYTSVAGLSVALGQILGGWLVSANLFDLGWRVAFYINIPICILILIIGYFIIPETQAEKKPKMDVQGILLFASLMLCLLIPVAMGEHWPQLFWLLFGVIPLAVLLIKVETKKELEGNNPLIPPAVFNTSTAKAGLFAEIGVTSTYAGYLFVTALTLQQAAHFTPFQSGNTFMGLGLMFFVGSLVSKSTSQRIGDYLTFTLGSALTIVGFLITLGLLWAFRDKVQVWQLLFATGFVGAGNSFMLSSAFRITLSNVEKQHASEASSALITVQQGFFALGTALTGSIYSVISPHGFLPAITTALVTISCIVFLVSIGTFLKRPK